MKLRVSGMPETDHVHMLHQHAIHMHPAHWLQNHTTVVSLLVATVIALLFIRLASMVPTDSVPPQFRRIHNGAWYLFHY